MRAFCPVCFHHWQQGGATEPVPPHECVATGRPSGFDQSTRQVVAMGPANLAWSQLQMSVTEAFFNRQSSPHPRRPLSPPTSDILTLAIRSFTAESEMQLMTQQPPSRSVRDWGGWMDVLPTLSYRSDDMLNPAITALAASITAHQVDLRSTKTCYFEAYGRAVQKLRTALRTADGDRRFMILATSICLYTADLMLPMERSTSYCQPHATGVQDLFQAIGAEEFAQVAHHKLFAGFRGSIIFEAIYKRKKSFASQNDWKTLPFRQKRQNTIQTFLTIAADIPPLLEQFDELQFREGFQRDMSVLALCQGFRTIICQVERTFTLEAAAPAHWTVPVTGSQERRFQFTTLSTASIYLNYWLVCSICFIHLHLLEFRYGPSDTTCPIADHRPLLDQAVEHATNIYMSMDFILQDEMRMQGPASRILTARVAYDILKFDGERSADKLAGFDAILQRFEEVGFKIPSLPDNKPFWSIATETN